LGPRISGLYPCPAYEPRRLRQDQQSSSQSSERRCPSEATPRRAGIVDCARVLSAGIAPGNSPGLSLLPGDDTDRGPPPRAHRLTCWKLIKSILRVLLDPVRRPQGLRYTLGAVPWLGVCACRDRGRPALRGGTSNLRETILASTLFMSSSLCGRRNDATPDARRCFGHGLSAAACRIRRNGTFRHGTAERRCNSSA
jgi:hypothetical protein